MCPLRGSLHRCRPGALRHAATADRSEKIEIIQLFCFENIDLKKSLNNSTQEFKASSLNELFDVNRSEGFIVSQADPLRGAESRSSENSSLESKVVVNDNLITRKEVLAAHKAWTNALVSISQTYKKDGFQAAKSLAGDVIDGAYGYQLGAVAFKPT
jgi:hypothetical protein